MKMIQKEPLNTQGFTMVELLVAMVVSLLALGAIYSTFLNQFKSYQVQEEVAAMQQNIRAAMYHMQREIRMAGYDRTGNAGAAIEIANVAELQFKIDENGDGDFTGTSPANDPNEQIRYALTNDGDGDGIADGSPCHLGRETWSGGLQILAENINALNFVYLDANGNTTTTLDDIRSVEITIVARTDEDLKTSTNNIVYKNQRDETILGAQNDRYSRKRLTAVVNCRNLGLF
jgi:type IV pilus assembly protein PilW